MATKEQVIEMNRAHPDWTARQIAEALGCGVEYVNATAHRNKLCLARSPDSRITEAMLRDWQERGVTVREAAAEVGMAIPTIRKREVQLNIRLKRERRHLAADCLRLAENGLTVPQAAAELGVSSETIRAVAKRKGITFRAIYKRSDAPPPVKPAKPLRFSCKPAAIQRAIDALQGLGGKA